MPNAVETATRQVLETYALMVDPARAEAARESVVDYLKTVFSAGEKDAKRLAVYGLAYLREKEGHSDPVSEGYTGL